MISIIIPAFDQHDMTGYCLLSIHTNTECGSYEIILVHSERKLQGRGFREITGV
jgi:hypothetical protein